MDEQRLERELRVGLADWLDPAVGEHPRWATSPAAGRVAGMPVRRSFSGRWGLLWAAALLALLLVALLAATVFVGARRPDHAVVMVPSPTPLARATCPPGSNPDALGPADQERPTGGAIAFDGHAGRIVLVDDDGFRTWTYDVCANTWQRRTPADQLSPADPGSAPEWLVYDADSDRTIALTPDGRFWSYDLAGDRWAQAGRFPDGTKRGWSWGSWRTGAVYHDPSGLAVVHDGATMWAYDVEAGTLTEIRQRPDPSRPAGSGLPPDPWAFDGAGAEYIGYDPVNNLLVVAVLPARPSPGAPHPAEETWTFDPSSGTWRFESAAPPPWSADIWGFEVGNSAAYAEVSGLTLFTVDSTGPWAFDGGQRAWRPFVVTGKGERRATWCKGGPVYDPFNGRLVCIGGARYIGVGQSDASGVSAFSSATGQWRWLLEPLPSASPAP